MQSVFYGGFFEDPFVWGIAGVAAAALTFLPESCRARLRSGNVTGTGSERLPARSTATSVSPVVGGAPVGCHVTRPPAAAPVGDLLPVEKKNCPRSLAHPVAHLHAVHSGNGLEDPDARGRRIDEDRIRDEDRAAVALEADFEPVEPIRNDLAGLVVAVPHEGAAAPPSRPGRR